MKKIDRSLEDRVRESAEDLRAIAAGIRCLSEVIGHKGTVAIKIDGVSIPVSTRGVFTKLFEIQVDRASLAFLDQLKNTGQGIPDSLAAYLENLSDDEKRVKVKNLVQIRAWKKLKGSLLEGLVFLSVLSRRELLHHFSVDDLFGPVPTVQVLNQGFDEFIWCRTKINHTASGLGATPDLTATLTDGEINQSTISSVIESKYHDKVTADVLRGQFGKAYDLHVNSYTIISYRPVSETVKKAAEALGLDLIEFQLHTKLRPDYLCGKRNIGTDFAVVLEAAQRKNSFLAKMDMAVMEAKKKLLI